MVVFSSDHSGWQRPADQAGLPAWESASWATDDDPPVHFDVAAFRAAETAVVDRTAETVTVRVSDARSTWAVAFPHSEFPALESGRMRANLTVAVDRDAATPERVTVTWSRPDQDAPRDHYRRVYAFDAWGETRVDRPASVPYTLRALLGDLAEWRTWDVA